MSENGGSGSSMKSPKVEDLSLIVQYLFLGNYKAATTESILRAHDIRRVFSVISAPEAISEANRFNGISYKHVVKGDNSNEDLLLDLPECVAYLDKAIKAKEATLVHCYMGISRSATVVTAYIMQSRHWSFDRALDFVRNGRPAVTPNAGFRAQLKLYERMAFRLNPNHKELRLHMYNFLLFRDFPEMFHQNLSAYLQRLAAVERSSKLSIDYVYRCTTCSKTVFTDLNILTPTDNPLNGNQLQHFFTMSTKGENTICKYYIIEPNIWMLQRGLFRDLPVTPGPNVFCGDMLCPHCNEKIGKFAFLPNNDLLCSCPEHFGLRSFLAIRIHRDFVRQKCTKKKGFWATFFG